RRFEREAQFSGVVEESERGGAWGVWAPGHALREAGGGTATGTGSIAAAAVSSCFRASEPAAGRVGITWTEAAIYGRPAGHIDIRLNCDGAGNSLRDAGGNAICC